MKRHYTVDQAGETIKEATAYGTDWKYVVAMDVNAENGLGNVTLERVRQFNEKWAKKEYDLLAYNCQHYCTAFLKEFCGRAREIRHR